VRNIERQIYIHATFHGSTVCSAKQWNAKEWRNTYTARKYGTFKAGTQTDFSE
jgi:hypothetical protein